MARRVTPDDLASFKALAHPTRRRLLYALTAGGPATATVLGQRLDVPANLVSFHLHRLKDSDLVTQDAPHDGDKRQRLWRVHDEAGISWSEGDFRDDPASAHALTAFQAAGYRTQAQLIADFQANADRWPQSWQSAAFFHDQPILLAPDELHALESDLMDVISRWRSRTSNGAMPADSKEQVLLLLYGFPTNP